MDIPTDLARLLLEIGTMAAWRGDTSDARTVLEGLHLVREDSAAPQISQAVAFMNEGRYQPATEILEDAIAKDDQCDVARVHLALACKLNGYSTRSQELSEQVVVSNRDTTAVELAKMLLAVPAGHNVAQTSPA